MFKYFTSFSFFTVNTHKKLLTETQRCYNEAIANPMKIRTLQHGEYRGCKVYYRNFGTTFEYLAVIKGQIYTAHITIIKAWWQMLLFQDYTEKQRRDVVNYLARIAESTIDHALDRANT